MKVRAILAVCLPVLLLTACGGGSSGSDKNPPSEKVVTHPGENQTITVGERVNLDGSASRVTNGEVASYQWQWVNRPENSTSSLDNSNTVRASFMADQAGEYQLKLTVSSVSGQQASANITVTANSAVVTPDDAIKVTVGEYQGVKIGDLVRLDGSESRVDDGEIASYQWRFIARPEESQASLTGADSARATFIADVAGTFSVELTVTSTTNQQNAARIEIFSTSIAENSIPIALIQSDHHELASGQVVTFNGGDSKDADGDHIAYAWTLISAPDGNTAVLAQPRLQSTTFTPELIGEYQVQLIVSDGQANSEPVLETISVTAESNLPPEVKKDNWPTKGVVNQALRLPVIAVDPNDDDIFFDWAFQHRPEGSQVVITNPHATELTFTPDVPGDYSVQLIVNDQSLASDVLVGVISVAEVAPPVAKITGADSVKVNQPLTLSASDSSDPADRVLGYQWRIVSGPEDVDLSDVEFTGAVTEQVRFVAMNAGTYRIELVVNNGRVPSELTEKLIEVTNNLKPQINLTEQPDNTVARFETIQFNASESTDPENTALTYQWEIIERPDNYSWNTIVGADTATPRFRPTSLGSYQIRLTVTDTDNESATQTLAFEVKDTIDVELRLGLQAVTSDDSNTRRLVDHPFTVNGQAFKTGRLGTFSDSITLFKPLADGRITIKTQLEGMPTMVYHSDPIDDDETRFSINLSSQRLPTPIEMSLEPEVLTHYCTEEKRPESAMLRFELEKFDDTEFVFESADSDVLPFESVVTFDTLKQGLTQTGETKTVTLFSHSSYKMSDTEGSHLFSRFIRIESDNPIAIFRPEVTKSIYEGDRVRGIWLCKP